MTPKTIEEREAARIARYHQLRKADKVELLARINNLRRIHGMSLKDSKVDLITVILGIEHPMPKNWSPS